MYDDKGKREMDREEYVRNHPIRAKILALYEQDEQRSPSLDELPRELSGLGATTPLVAYHLRVLNDAGLLSRASD
ncbi:MAG TPA: hypothetical protein VFW48_09835 [Solirubrobacterales bacterium]|nr:hypothetical protein [Solirubrobacterales bacterium]